MSTASENLNMTKKRGQKLCKKCKTPNGVRAYNCKKCDDPFPMKKKQKNKRQVITDYKTLKKGARIRVVGGSGPYHLDQNNEKHYLTDRGVYIVKDIEDNGIHVYGGTVNNRAYSYLYMGKETKSAVCDNVYRSPHKILLLSDVSPHPRLS